MPRSTRRPRERLEGPEAQMQKLLDALANPTKPKRRRKVTRKKARVKAAAPRRKTVTRKSAARKTASKKRANAARRTTTTAKRNPRTTSKWWRFTLYGDRGARVGRAVGQGNALEAAKEGSKLARRDGVRRVVMDGPYASMQAAL